MSVVKLCAEVEEVEQNECKEGNPNCGNGLVLGSRAEAHDMRWRLTSSIIQQAISCYSSAECLQVKKSIHLLVAVEVGVCEGVWRTRTVVDSYAGLAQTFL